MSLTLFLSHASADARWAAWLDVTLRDAGYRTHLYPSGSKPAEIFPSKISAAVDACDAMLCLLSESYVASHWCTEEWSAALCNRTRLVPVLVGDCAVPALLGTRTHVDLRGVKDEGAGRELVLAALRKLSGAGGDERQAPPYPGHAEGKRGTPYPGTLPDMFVVPYAPNPQFRGRADCLAALHAELAPTGMGAKVLAISGLGGVGKTQLALEYIYRFADEYAAVCFLRAEDPLVLAAEYAALATPLRLDKPSTENAAIDAVRSALGSRGRSLLVFDNARTAEAIEAYLPRTPLSHVLVTTTATSWAGAPTRRLSGFSLEESVAILLERSAEHDVEAAREIAVLVDGLPLALEQACAYISARQKTLSSYLELLRAHGLRALDRERAYGYARSVSTTWALAMDSLEEVPGAGELLKLFAFLNPDAIPLAELCVARDELPPPLDRVLGTDLALDDARAALLSRSLVTADGDFVSVHRLVQQVTREQLSDADQRAWRSAVLRAFRRIFPYDADDIRNWPLCAKLLPHALELTNDSAKMACEPEAAVYILNQVGLYLKKSGAYRTAEAVYRRALEFDEQRLDPDHAYLAVRLNNLAMVLLSTDRRKEAIPLLRRSIAIAQRAFGSDHHEFAVRLNNLALTLIEPEHANECELLARRALAIEEAHWGPEHPEVATCLGNLAGALVRMNRCAEAEPLLRRAVAIDEAALPANHPDLAIHLGSLATVLRKAERSAEAESLLRQCLEIQEGALGSEHPTLSETLRELGRLLHDAGRLAEALPFHRRALAISEAVLGRDAPRLTLEYNQLAVLSQDAGDLGGAEALMRREIELAEQMPNGEQSLGVALNNLASLLQDTGRMDQARASFDRALEVLTRAFGEEHEATQLVRQNMDLRGVGMKRSISNASVAPSRHE